MRQQAPDKWKKAPGRKGIFLLFLHAVVIVPIFLFPIISAFFHEIHPSPKIENGTLDLSGYNFEQEREIPLDGKWQFYWNKWIVTDKGPVSEPDALVTVPSTWNRFSLNGERLPSSGYASYRLFLKNCPPGSNLLSYIPNLGAAYRVFLDGHLIASSGTLSKQASETNITLALMREWFHDEYEKDRELVIEVSSVQVGGLYLSPILVADQYDFYHSKIRNMLMLIYIGVLIVTIGCNTYVLFLNDPSFHSAALLVLDLMVFFRILVKNELFASVKFLLPFLQYHTVNAVLQVLTLFLPAAFLLCAKDLIGLKLQRWDVRSIILFELACCVPILYGLASGLTVMQYFFSFFSFLPFVFVWKKLYQLVRQGVPYSFCVLLTMTLILVSLIVSSQYSSGLLVMNVSLFPPTYFVAAAFLQNYMYIRKNQDMRKDALEASNLRLKLRESETALMLSQIKPHFLYNALLAIQVLCTREPETAQEAISNFSRYLRANMNSINSPSPIPFHQELEHIRNYVAIEKLRFKERLHIVYKVETENFCVPPLTIQPLVENAIKHGACRKVMGGTVTLCTYEEDGWNCVEILDDGPGFDPAALNEDSCSHGLKNISFRLKELMRAQIEISSSPEHGTRVLVQIPKAEDGHESNHSG